MYLDWPTEGGSHALQGSAILPQSSRAQPRSAWLQGALKAADIVPSKDAVSTSDFMAALTKKFGYEPILFCDEDRSGNKYIDSVRSTAALQKYL